MLPAKAAILTVTALLLLTVFFYIQYQNVIATDSYEGQIMNQLTLVKVEYNSSDPLTITGTHSEDRSFECNFTIQNPTIYSMIFLGIYASYYREQNALRYPIADGQGSSSGNTTLVTGNNTYSVRMYYITNSELPPDANTTPVFLVAVSVKRSFSARIVAAEVYGSSITNEGAVSRPLYDETFNMLSLYSSLSMAIWPIGLGSMLIVGLLRVERTKIRQFAGFNFLLVTYAILCLLLFPKLPYPPPYQENSFLPPATGGIVGLEALISLSLEVGAGLSLLTAVGLLLHMRWATILAYLLGILSIPFFVFNGIYFAIRGFAIQASLLVIAVATLIAIIRLSRVGHHL